ncbi:MAG: histidine kinase [Bacteroidota bacterium]|nr:histidine kinase [Bacteroidota bacterium]
MKKISRFFDFKKIASHFCLWLLSLALFLVLIYYTRGFRLDALDFNLTVNILMTIIFLAISVYINLLWLIPSFFNRKKYFLFFVLELMNILLFIVLNFIGSMAFEKSPSFFSIEVVAELILVLIFLIISTLIKFTQDSIALQNAELKIKEIEKQKIESELQALKTQVNPHFFFNTLNSLYSLSLEKSDKTPEMILKLSEMMRYILYEAKDKMIPISRQLEVMKSYIYLERLRSNETLRLDLEVKGEMISSPVAPLIFIPFVENAFKHGAKSGKVNPYIRIFFDLESGEKIFFMIENNKDKEISLMPNQKTGIGLLNVKKQLELLYPGKHNLEITENDDIYHVELTLVTV